VATARYGTRSVVFAGVTAAAVLVTVVGCQRQSPRFSGSDAPKSVAAINAVTDASGNQTVTLQMTDLLRFVPSTVNVKAGTITVTLNNAGGDPHQFEVPSLNVSTGNIPGHTSKVVTFTIPAGTHSYPFDCAYHTSEHMVGTLTVAGF
jgi:plastocyanin